MRDLPGRRPLPISGPVPLAAVTLRGCKHGGRSGSCNLGQLRRVGARLTILWLIAGAGVIAVAGILLLFGLETHRQARDRDRYPPPGRLIDVGGRRLQLLGEGEGRPTVVLVCGGGMPSVYMWPLQRRVAAFAHVVTYDRAGFGWSDPATSPLSFDDQARDLRTLLARGGETAPFLLAGESLGGLIVRAFATLFPEDVAGVVLIDSAEEEHVFATLDHLKAGGARQIAMARLLGPLGLVRQAVARSLRHAYATADRRIIAALLSRASFAAGVAQEVKAYDLTPEARRGPGGFGALGDIPLTVMAHGKPFPDARIEGGWRAAQERLARLSTRGRLVVAEGIGHAIAEENPKLVAREIQLMVEEVLT